MSEGTEPGAKEGAFVTRYTKGESSETRRRESHCPEKQGAAGHSGGSRYPEKNAWNPRAVQSGSRYPEKQRQEERRNTNRNEMRSGTDSSGLLQGKKAVSVTSAQEKKAMSVASAPGKKEGGDISGHPERQTGSVPVNEKSKRREEYGPAREISEHLVTADHRKSHSAERKERELSAKTAGRPGWQQLLRDRKVKRLRVAAGCFFGLIAVIYIGVAVYFGSHFYEGTVIYGVDCSQMTSEEAKDAVADRLGDYTLTLQERGDVQETISARQIELKFLDNGSIGRALGGQRSYVWPIMILIKKSSQASVSFVYNQAKVEKLLNQMDCFNDILTVKPQNAYIGTTEHGFEVVPEVQGTALDQKKTLKAVLAALDSGAQTLSFEEKGCYLAPEICQDNQQLIQDAASMNELAQADIVYDFGDRTETVDVSVIQDWIVKLDDGSFAIDDTKVTEFVSELAEKYDTFGGSRDFYTSYGTVVSLSGGDYGWAIDQDETTLALLRALEEGYKGVMEPEYAYTAMCRDTNDIGYTYVEICISQQRMLCYKDGVVIVDTPVVTGNPNKGNATPAGGVWAIDAKMRNYVLVGEGYRAPVDYWMPFNGDVGIHDLKERAYFGGTIYLTNGSHGCVNTPYDQVAMIYDAVSVGTPVIVYDNP